MSNVILNAVFQHSKAEGVARLVLLSLADRADDSGRAWCGAKDLCDRTRASRRQVKEVVPQLCEMGELAIVGKWGPKRCNVYQITLDQCDQRTSAATALVQSPPLTSAARAPKPSRTHKNSLRRLVGKPGPLKL
jgi:hypothetical protein